MMSVMGHEESNLIHSLQQSNVNELAIVAETGRPRSISLVCR
jgi:hypothetical protein